MKWPYSHQSQGAKVRYITVQEHDFDVAIEYKALCADNSQDGAVVFFVGRMRDLNLGASVSKMTLEHYPSMTEKTLVSIVEQAEQRWPINRVRLIHRVGVLLPADQIVFVGVTSPHRQAAFSATEFIMDFLKTQAPFWKKESTNEGERWVEARESDVEQARHWNNPS